VLRDWGQVAALAQRTPLADYLIQVRHARPGPLALPAAVAIPPAPAPASIRAAAGTPVTQPVDVGRATRTVVLTNPAYPGWRLAGFRTNSQFGVTVAFTRPRGPDSSAVRTAVYGPWRLVRACDVAGACLVAVDAGLLAAVLVRRRVNGPARKDGQRSGTRT
jgi:hypothetical protein